MRQLSLIAKKPTKEEIITIKMLDLCCGEGGCSVGYYRAASKIKSRLEMRTGSKIRIEVTGIDKRYMKRYPFKFVQADALQLDYEYLEDFDFIHASPPCKAYTKLSYFARVDIDKSFLPRILTTLEAAGKPYVIENVPQAPIRADIQLDGTMFDLPLKRRRIFQTNRPASKYPRPTSYYEKCDIVTVAGNSSTLEAASKAMGIDWMSKKGINEAIPPAYTEWIGEQILGNIISQKYYTQDLKS